MNKKWQVYETNETEINKISEKYHLNKLLATIIVNRKINENELEVFLNPTRKNFHDPFLMPDMKKAVERIIQAINYGDYEFVYEKLNQVQKNNYYKNYNDFKEYITKNFFKENNYELGDDFLIVSEGKVYQFDVKITDATGEDYSYGKFVMTVTLKDNDFEISITTQN